MERCLERDYGIHVDTRDIPAPLIGDLDGAEIHIDPAVTPEQRLFMLAHLFGHTVQWNVDPRALDFGKDFKPPVPESQMAGVIAYESEAAAYGLEMLHRAGVADADQWFSDYGKCDEAYLLHYYRTGQRGNFRDFWSDGTSKVMPKPVPKFTPVKRRFRMDGVVI